VGWRSIGITRTEHRIGDQIAQQTRYCLSCLSSLAGSVRIVCAVVHSHWGIESSARWVLDVAGREDESRVRAGRAVPNLAWLWHIAVNLLRHEPMARCGINSMSCASRLAGISHLLTALVRT
jgi:predicted transposase YbfD/YdcC